MKNGLVMAMAVLVAVVFAACGDTVANPDGGGRDSGRADGSTPGDGGGGTDGASADGGNGDAGDSDGGGGGDGGDDGGGSQDLGVKVTPSSANVQANIGTVQFSAVVWNAVDPSVVWSIKDDMGGGASGTIDDKGLYKAPPVDPPNPVVIIQATSVEDGTKYGTASVKITPPVKLSVSPKTASVKINSKFNFAADIQFASDRTIAWEVVGGDPNDGKIEVKADSRYATYTAPAAVPANVVAIKATSQLDPSKTDTASVTVKLPIKVTVTPAKAIVNLTKSQQFTAVVENASQDVTWSIDGGAEMGSIDQTGLYTAPSLMPATKFVSIRAASKDDPAAIGFAQVSIVPPVQVYIDPYEADVAIQFTAFVGNTSDTAVTWSIVNDNGSKGTISGTGLYTAPQNIPAPDTVVIKAVSHADPSKSDTSDVHVKPLVTTFAGSTFGFKVGNGTAAQLGSPAGISLDTQGHLFVADTSNNVVRRFTIAGAAETAVYCGSGTWGMMSYSYSSCTAAMFATPAGLSAAYFTAGDDTSVRVYVADTANNAISRTKYRSSTYSARLFSGTGSHGYADDTGGTGQNAMFANPTGAVVTPARDNLYVADFGNNRIRRVWTVEDNTDGRTWTLAGSDQGFADGTGTAAKFSGPYGVALDASGNIIVGDFNNHAVRKVTTGGVVTTIAGNGTPGSSDGACAGARFYNPAGVAVDSSGNIYIADSQNHVIRRITFTGGCNVSTLAGSYSYGFNDNCAGPAAKFNKPTGVAVTPDGKLVYVADQQNNRIRLIKMGQ
jgi:DNA-binding beta-propeller fold protein YncE